MHTIKNALAKVDSNINLQAALQDILIRYRVMPHSSTEMSPAELLFGRKIRCKRDLLKPAKSTHCKTYNENKKVTTFTCGEKVAVRNYVGKEKFFGIVSKREGKLHYSVKLEDGRVWRHVDQMRSVGSKNVKYEPYIPEDEPQCHHRKRTKL